MTVGQFYRNTELNQVNLCATIAIASGTWQRSRNLFRCSCDGTIMRSGHAGWESSPGDHAQAPALLDHRAIHSYNQDTTSIYVQSHYWISGCELITCRQNLTFSFSS